MSTRNRVATALALLCLSSSAGGDGLSTSMTPQTGGGISGGFDGGVVPPPTCPNSLNFTEACNSQYVGLL